MTSLWIVFAGIAWGLDGLIRSRIGGVSPLTIVTIEHLIGFIIIAIIGIKHLSFPKLSAKAWGALISVALFSGLVGTSAFTWAMGHVHYSSFTALFLLLKLQPIFAIFAAFFFLGERPKKTFYALAFVALIASFFMSFGRSGLDLSFGSDVLRATLAGLVAAVCWGSATIFSRYLSHQGYKSRTMTCYRLGMVALIGFITLGVFSLTGSEMQFALPDSNILLLIMGVALLSGVLGTTMYYRGIRHTPAALASIFELSLPITGFILDLTIHHKILDLYQWIGALVLIAVMSMIVKRST